MPRRDKCGFHRQATRIRFVREDVQSDGQPDGNYLRAQAGRKNNSLELLMTSRSKDHPASPGVPGRGKSRDSCFIGRPLLHLCRNSSAPFSLSKDWSEH